MFCRRHWLEVQQLLWHTPKLSSVFKITERIDICNISKSFYYNGQAECYIEVINKKAEVICFHCLRYF